jgi:hypothetical protein
MRQRVCNSDTPWLLPTCNLAKQNCWLQLFAATLTYREAYPRGETDFHKSIQVYRSVACISLLICAGIYILGALLCIGAIRKGEHEGRRQGWHNFLGSFEFEF